MEGGETLGASWAEDRLEVSTGGPGCTEAAETERGRQTHGLLHKDVFDIEGLVGLGEPHFGLL